MLLMLAAGLPAAFAYNFQSGGIYYDITGSNTVAVTYATGSYNSYSGSVTIPSTVNYNGTHFTVTAIGNRAFSNCSNLTGVTIPNTVTSIGEYAFYYCQNLPSVTIPNGVETIGGYAFYNCSSLDSVTIPNSVTTIEAYAFSSCEGLAVVTIGKSVTSIGNYAFTYCSALTTVFFNADSCINMGSTAMSPFVAHSYGGGTGFKLVIGNNVKNIPDNAFARCYNLDTLNIPPSVSRIGKWAFYFSGITNLHLSEGLAEIDHLAFCGCGMSSVNIPSTVSSIAPGAFATCPNISVLTVSNNNQTYDSRNNCKAIVESNTNTLVVGCKNSIIPSNVTAIGKWAFSGCSGLTGAITIHDQIKNIGDMAFERCTGIVSLTIGKSVDSIGNSAFYQCSALSSVTFNPDSCIYMGSGEYIDDYGNGYVFANSGLSSLTIGDNVKIIPSNAFNGCNTLSGMLNFPNSVKIIGDNAFSGCSALTGNLVLPDSIFYIGDAAFYDCSGLTETLTIPRKVKYIGKNAFNKSTSVIYNADSCDTIGCISYIYNDYSSAFGNLTSLQIGDNVKYIPPYSFSNKIGLTGTLIIPDSVITIGERAFAGCNNIDTLIIGNLVSAIGQYAFYGCTGLDSLVIGNAVAYIGQYAFYNCTGLTGTLYLPNVDTIGYRAFYNCGGINSLILGEGVKYIGGQSFYNCNSLTGMLNIPNSVTNIGGGAFYGCTSFGTLVIGRGVAAIGSDAFKNCIGLTYVTFNADSCTSIGQYNSDVGFAGDTNITYLSLGENVKIIPKNAFYGGNSTPLSKLSGKLEIPNSVIEIGQNAFKGCSGYDTLVIGRGVKIIHQYAFDGWSGLTTLFFNADSCESMLSTQSNGYYTSCFYNCANLVNLTLGNNVKFIPQLAFEDCSHLTGTIIIPDSLKTISSNAFNGCTGIDTLIIGKSVQSIGYNAFKDCTQLTKVNFNADSCITMMMGAGTSNISSYTVFNGCTNITSLNISNNVKTIPPYAFYGLNHITGTLTIPDSVVFIGGYAFNGCSGYSSLILGRSVDTIGQRAFPGNIASIYSYLETPPAVDKTSSYQTFYSVNRNTPVYVPCGSAQAYRNAWIYSSTSTNSYFYNIYETLQPYLLTAIPADTLQGTVHVTTQGTCTEPAVIEATPNFFYVFDHWSDGNTDNPRTVALTQDTTLVAHFREYSVTVVSSDSTGGSVILATEPTVDEPFATAFATLTDSSCHMFAGWSDGSMENPHTISVSHDTVLTAIFNSVVNLQLSAPAIVCQGDSVTFTAVGADSYLWFNGATTSSVSMLPENTLEVSVTGTDNNGCSTTKEQYVNVLSKPTLTLSGLTEICEGDSTLIEAISSEISHDMLNENFDGGFPSDWTFSNTHLHIENVSGNHNNAIIFPAFDVSGSDELIMPILKTVALHKPILQFDVAYRRYPNIYNDKLSVYYSSDNGESWIQMYSKSSNELSTVAGYSSQSFVPTDEQWRSESIDLSNISGNIIIKFTFESDWGNNIWLDNIIVKSPMNTHNVLMSENFETGLSEDWSIIDVDGDGYSWYPASRINYGMAPDPYSGNYCAIAFVQNYYSSYSYENSLSTPTVTIPATGATLEWVANSAYGQHASYEIRVVSNSGSTMIYSGTEYGSDNWAKRSVNLDNWAGQNIKVVFVHLGGPALMIDDIVMLTKDNFVWSDGTVSLQHTFTSSGTWQLTVTDNNGCSSTDSVTVTVWQPDTTELTVDAATASYTLNGETFCTSGDYTQTLQSIHGCDSVVNLHLTIRPDTMVIYDTLCVGERAFEQSIMSPGEYQQTLAMLESQFGDSIPYELTYDTNTHIVSVKAVTVYISEYWQSGVEEDYGGWLNPTYDYYDTTIYLNYNVWKDSSYYNFTYTLTYPSSLGCDSTVTKHLTAKFSDASYWLVTACGSYVWNGDTIVSSGEYYHSFTNVNGCDSTETLYLTVLPSVSEELSATTCDSYTWNGITYTESGDYTLNSDTTLALVRNLYVNNWGEWGYDDADGNFIYLQPNGWSQLQVHTDYDSETGDYTYYYYYFDQNGAEHLYNLGDIVPYIDTVPGCKSATLHLTLTQPTTGDTTAVACNSFTWHGNTYTQSGDYTYTATSATGCDSVVTLHLTVTQPTIGDTTAVACNSFTWHGNTYTQSGDYTYTATSATGCDSVVTLYLTITQPTIGDTTAVACESFTWHGTTYTQSGNYTHTMTNATGCDSVVTLHLTILPLPIPNITGATTVCEGQTATLTATGGTSYLWEDGTTTSTYAATVSGLYTVTVTNAEGCSATASATVTVNPLPEVAVTGNTYICPGGSTILTATGADSYMWSNGSTNASIPVNMFGQYSVIGTSADGCFSTASVTVLVSQPPVITISGNTNLCAGESTTLAVTGGASYMWSNGSTDSSITVNTAGNWQVIGYNESNCSNMASVTVNVWQPASSDLYITSFDSCYVWFGTPRCESGNYTYALQTIHGCDSVITLHLTLEDAITNEFSATACNSYTWNGITYSQSGSYTQTFTAGNGNDSIVTLHLTIYPAKTAEIAETVCDIYEWNSQTYTSSGDYIQTFTAVNGCDSTVTLHLTVNHSTAGDTTAIACESFSWHGNTYTQSGNYTYTTTNAAGCDSVVTLHLTVNQPAAMTDSRTVCANELPIVWNGVPFAGAGTQTATLQTVNGCDSVVTMTLTVNQPTAAIDEHTVCGSFTWIDGNTYTASTNVPTFTLTNAAGCDSVVTLYLTVNQPTTGDTTAAVCGSFEWHGNTYTQSGNYTYTTTNAAGCDSVVTLHLTIQQPTTGDTTAVACESFTWYGNTYTESGDYTCVLSNAAGCDSVVTLHLTIHHTPVFNISGNLEINQGQSTMLSVPNNAGWTYLWSTGETASFIIASPSVTSTYSVTVTEGSCSASDSVTVTVNTGLNDHEFGNLTVYPNPTMGIANVQFTDYQNPITKIHLYDAYGKLVAVVAVNNDGTTPIDLSRFASGVYFVKAMADGNVVAVRKVVKR